MHSCIEKDYEVAVVGGGPGGIPAAIAAGRSGKKVVLIERNSYLGGVATSGLGLLGYIDREGNKALGGLAEELFDRLMEMHGAIGHYRCPVHNSISPISPDVFKIVALEMCLEAGVDVLFNQELLDVKVDNNQIKSITVYGKCTELIVNAEVFIDATGDGDLAYMAGANYHLGQDGTGIMQPSTLMFTVTNYDIDKFLKYVEDHPEDYGVKEEYAKGYDPEFFRKTPGHCFIGLTEMIKKARSKGDFDIPRNQFIYITTPIEGILAINTSRITHIDASDPIQLSRGLVDGYKQVHHLLRFMKKYVPGFEDVRLAEIAPSLGIRETRHIEGVYTLKRSEMYSSYVKEHAIAQSAYNIDIHSGTASHIDLTLVEEPFGIPYGCLVPKSIEGLILSGRTISVDTETYASVRVMGPCIAIGEAAGEAASLCIDQKIHPREVDIQSLRLKLRDNGNIF